MIDSDSDMEVGAPSSSATFIPWNPPPSIPPPEIQFNHSGNGFQLAVHPDRLRQHNLTPAGAQLSYCDNPPSTSGFLDIPAINEASSSGTQSQVGENVPHLSLLPSPFGHDAGTANLSRFGLVPGPHKRAQQDFLPRIVPYPILPRAPGYTYDSTTEDHDYRKNPDSIPSSLTEDHSQSVGGTKFLKSFGELVEQMVSKIKRLRPSAAGCRKPATDASMSDMGSSSSNDGWMQNSQEKMSSTTQSGPAGANVESNRCSPTRDTVKAHDQAKHEFTIFGRSKEANILSAVCFNTSGGVTVNNGVPSRQPHDNVAGAEDIHPTHEHNSTIAMSGSAVTEHSEYEIYYKYLLVKKRGFPLWVPGPDSELPLEYRKNGLSIGDAVILNPATGCFDFLFNIFLAADDEINQGRVPEGFKPLVKPKAQKNMKKDPMDLDRCFMSSSVRRTDSSDFIFHTTRSEGAILVIPDGGLSEDWQNHTLIKNYIASNAEGWLKYVESDDCGVPTEDGIKVVVGTDKVSSWGMTTFQNVESSMQFEFKSYGTASRTRPSQWKGIHGRIWPAEEGIRDHLMGPAASPLRNQCVFVRTLNVAVSGAIPDKLAVEVSTGCSTDCMSDSSRHEAQPRRRIVEIQSSQVNLSSVSHPSKFLNKYLLEKCTDAKVVITSDSDWISTITKNDTTMPSVEEICTRVLASNIICQDKGGVVTLEKREKVVQVSTSTTTTSAHQQTTSDELSPINEAGTTNITNPSSISLSSVDSTRTSPKGSSLRTKTTTTDPGGGRSKAKPRRNYYEPVSMYPVPSELLSKPMGAGGEGGMRTPSQSISSSGTPSVAGSGSGTQSQPQPEAIRMRSSKWTKIAEHNLQAGFDNLELSGGDNSGSIDDSTDGSGPATITFPEWLEPASPPASQDFLSFKDSYSSSRFPQWNHDSHDIPPYQQSELFLSQMNSPDISTQDTTSAFETLNIDPRYSTLAPIWTEACPPSSPRGSPNVMDVTQFDPLLPFSLITPDEGRLEDFGQVKRLSRAMLKSYSETFPGPVPQSAEHKFKEFVGSQKIGRASMMKRKDPDNWVCLLCGSTFTRKQNLKIHLQSHLGIKPHQCICGAAFNALSGLKRHEIRCHTLFQSREKRQSSHIPEILDLSSEIIRTVTPTLRDSAVSPSSRPSPAQYNSAASSDFDFAALGTLQPNLLQIVPESDFRPSGPTSNNYISRAEDLLSAGGTGNGITRRAISCDF